MVPNEQRPSYPLEPLDTADLPDRNPSPAPRSTGGFTAILLVSAAVLGAILAVVFA